MKYFNLSLKQVPIKNVTDARRRGTIHYPVELPLNIFRALRYRPMWATKRGKRVEGFMMTMSQETMADILNTNQRKISRIETDCDVPTVAHLKILMSHGVTQEQIFAIIDHYGSLTYDR